MQGDFAYESNGRARRVGPPLEIVEIKGTGDSLRKGPSGKPFTWYGAGGGRKRRDSTVGLS